MTRGAHADADGRTVAVMRLVIASIGLLVGCSPAPDPSPTPLPRRALVLGVDGVRADTWDRADLPALDAAFAAGEVTLTASTQRTGVTVSGPGWASVLTGTEVEDHGVVDNGALVDLDRPTFVEQAEAAGRPAAVIAHWPGIVTLVGLNAAERVEIAATDADVGVELAGLVTAGRHDLIFGHFDDVDHAGHASGFSAGNAEYVAALEGVDGFVAAALAAVDADAAHDWLVIACTDHGGGPDGHGAMDDDNRIIPLAMAGADLEVPAAPNHMDVAATVLDWFGLSTDGLDGVSWLR